MRRKRQQDGYIFKARGIWYVRYFDTRVINGEVKRVRIAKQIARVRDTINGVLTTITKAKARELAAPTLVKINQPDRAPETAVSLIDFVERVYLPRMEQQKRPSTFKGYRDLWNNHLKARSVGLWMREIRTCDVQRLLDDIAKPGTLSSNSLRHIKSHISAVFPMPNSKAILTAKTRPATLRSPRRGPQKKPTLTALRKSRRFSRLYRSPLRPFSP